MPQNVVDVDTFTATVQCQADGDAVNGASCLVPAQDLSDRTRWLHNRVIESVGGDLLVPLTPISYGATARWGFVDTTGSNEHRVMVNHNIGGTDEALIPLPTLHNCTFDEVEIYVDGGWGIPITSTTHGALPTMPRLTLYHIDTTTGTEISVGNQVDTSANVAAYEVPHPITLSVAAQTMDSTSAFYASIRGESGGSAVPDDLAVLGMTIQVVPA